LVLELFFFFYSSGAAVLGIFEEKQIDTSVYKGEKSTYLINQP
jgi:hypothetical protein